MTTLQVWASICGVSAILAAGVMRRSTRKWVTATASVLALAGWGLLAQFVLKYLVPWQVLVAIILGGIVLGILASAVIGRRKARREEAEGR